MNEYEYSKHSSSHHNNHDTQHSHQLTEQPDQPLSWYNRDGRSHPLYLQKEEENLFKEHLNNLQKKTTLNIEALGKIEFSITYNSEVQNDEKDIDLGNQPLDKFDTLKDVHKQLGSNIHRLRFDYMTPIQKVVIPYMQQGRDVMGCSETGSGKTIAYLFPVISLMLKKGPPQLEATTRKTAYPTSLILVPTRELADQVYKESKKMCYQTGINTVRVYGGVPYDSQISSLSLGCDILVATPGRLIDYLKTSTISLKAVNTLIIDEADRILDMGFEDQLNAIIFTYDLHQKEKRQNLMFSATFSPEVRKIARKFMNEFYFVQPKSVAPKQIKQEIIKASDSEKSQMLSQILQKIRGSIIIFLDTKRGVDTLSYFLYNSRFKCCSIHGDKKQNQRQNAIENFTLGNVPILIATDVASRGLDFPNVNYVINYDLPKNLEDYIHRIGRTGRMGQEGTAISFINEGNKPIIKKLYLFFKNQGQAIPPWFEEMYAKEGEEDHYKRTAKFKMNMNFNRPNNFGYMTNMNRSMFNGYRMNNMPPFTSNNTGIVPLSAYGMDGTSNPIAKNDYVNGNSQVNGFNQVTSNNAYASHPEQLNDNSNKERDKVTTNNAINNNSTYQSQNHLMYYQKVQKNIANQAYPSDYNINYAQRTNYHHSAYYNNHNSTTPTLNSSNNEHNHHHSNQTMSNSNHKAGEGDNKRRSSRSKSKSKDNDKNQSRSHSHSHSNNSRKQSYKSRYHRHSNRISRSRSRNKRQHYRSSSHSHSRNHNKRRERSRDRDRSASRSRSLRNKNKSRSISRSRSRELYSRDKGGINSQKQMHYRNNSRDPGNKNNTYYYSNRNRSNGRDEDIPNTKSTNW